MDDIISKYYVFESARRVNKLLPAMKSQQVEPTAMMTGIDGL